MHTVLPNGQIIYEQDYSCIVEPQNEKGGIYIGNLESAQNIKTLKKHGIKAILTASKGVCLKHTIDQIPFYLQVPGEDREGFDLSKFFYQSNSFIKRALQRTSIMVHCLAGVSRSVCLVIAYLIQHRGFSYDEAYALIKSKRGIIHPNDGFISQLRQFENETRGSRTCSFSKLESKKQLPQSSKKRRYQYFYDNEEECSIKKNTCKQNKFMLQRTASLYNIPPSRKLSTINCPSTYQSPQKKPRLQYCVPNNQPTQSRVSYSPKKWRFTSNTFESQDFIPLYKQINQSRLECSEEMIGRQSRIQTKCNSPIKKRIINQRDKSINGNIDVNLNGRDINTNNKFVSYNRLKYASTEISKELDSKIAAIRQKYFHFSKKQLLKSPKMQVRQQQFKPNNYHDQNDHRLSMTLNLRKNGYDYDTFIIKDKDQHRMVKNKLEKLLGLGKVNYLREGY